MIDQGTVRGIASARAHGRQTSHMSEPRFSPAHSPDETANTSPAISPTLPISSTSSAVQYTSDSASHSNPDGTNGSSAATRSSVGSSILRRVATAESFDTSFGGSAVVGDMSAKSEGRSGRLNTHSVKKDGASRSLSRRPSNLPPDLQTVGDFAQEHLFTSVRAMLTLCAKPADSHFSSLSTRRTTRSANVLWLVVSRLTFTLMKCVVRA